jgi:hypothetical protein
MVSTADERSAYLKHQIEMLIAENAALYAHNTIQPR